MLVGFEQLTDVQCLPSPEVSVDGPVEGQLQCAPVERPVEPISDRVASLVTFQRTKRPGW